MKSEILRSVVQIRLARWTLFVVIVVVVVVVVVVFLVCTFMI